jgi:hypothetical protein
MGHRQFQYLYTEDEIEAGLRKLPKSILDKLETVSVGQRLEEVIRSADYTVITDVLRSIVGPDRDMRVWGYINDLAMYIHGYERGKT